MGFIKISHIQLKNQPSFKILVNFKLCFYLCYFCSQQTRYRPRASIPYRARLHGEFHPRLKFQTGFWNKSCENQVVDYMERDSARGAIHLGLKILARYSQTGLGFSARPNGLKNPCNRYHFFSPGWKRSASMRICCFRTAVNFLTEIGILRPGWNWACNRNNISARWVERNFSPGWNSPCNQAHSRPHFWSQLGY